MSWGKGSLGNEILQGNDFYISYLKPSEIRNYLDNKVSQILSINEIKIKDLNREETALVDEREEPIYYILIGDFRKEYEELIDKGFDACFEFYNKMKLEFRSDWSSDKPIEPGY